jgi:hypothetical protein
LGLQISRTQGSLVLQWVTQLANGASIRRPVEAYAVGGALARVPRLDGRGCMAAQVG